MKPINARRFILFTRMSHCTSATSSYRCLRFSYFRHFHLEQVCKVRSCPCRITLSEEDGHPARTAHVRRTHTRSGHSERSCCDDTDAAAAAAQKSIVNRHRRSSDSIAMPDLDSAVWNPSESCSVGHLICGVGCLRSKRKNGQCFSGLSLQTGFARRLGGGKIMFSCAICTR